MTTYYYTGELYHHGVKGMKWGVRRNKTTSLATRLKSMTKKTIPEDAHEDYKNAHSKKSVSSMSDAELRSRINRLQMEQQLSKLSPSVIDVGKTHVQNTLKVATTVATVTGTALTIYNNIDKIKNIIEKTN